jgi:hypothetical protein
VPSTPGAGLLVYRLAQGGVEVLLFHRARLRPVTGGQELLYIPTWELDPPPAAAPGRAGLPFDSRPRVKQRVVARRSMDQLLQLACANFVGLTGLQPAGPFLPLGGVKMRLHRVVYVWACSVEAPGPQGPPGAVLSSPPAARGATSPSPSQDPTPAVAFTPEYTGASAGHASYAGAEFLRLAEARALVEPQQRRFLDQLEGLLARPKV